MIEWLCWELGIPIWRSPGFALGELAGGGGESPAMTFAFQVVSAVMDICPVLHGHQGHVPKIVRV